MDSILSVVWICFARSVTAYHRARDTMSNCHEATLINSYQISWLVQLNIYRAKQSNTQRYLIVFCQVLSQVNTWLIISLYRVNYLYKSSLSYLSTNKFKFLYIKIQSYVEIIKLQSCVESQKGWLISFALLSNTY